MPAIGVSEILGFHEERLEAFLGSGNDSGVVTEQQTTQHSHQDDGEQVRFATFLILIHVYRILKLNDFLRE